MFDGLKDKAGAALQQAGEAAHKAGEAAGSAARTAGELGGKAVDKVKTTADEAVEDLSDSDTPAETRAKLDRMAASTLDRLLAERSDIKPLLDASAGYAVFDTRQVQWGVAGAYGRGVAVQLPGGERTYMRMGSAGVGIGFGLGGFDTQIVILFESPFVYQKFIVEGLDATAEAGSMVGDDKERLALGFENGRAAFVLTDKGWKISAKLSGTRYWADKQLNAPES